MKYSCRPEVRPHSAGRGATSGSKKKMLTADSRGENMFIGRKQWKCAGNSKERIESEKRKKENQLLKKGENI